MTKEIINVNLYGGKSIFGGRESPLEASIVSCDKFESCSYYKESQCIGLRGFLSEKCRYGNEQTVKGYTSRAQKYHQFRNKWKGHEQYNKLDRPSKKLGLIDGVVVFPYNYIQIEETETGDFKIKDPMFGSSIAYIDYDKFTVDLIHRICTFKPQALMGGTISDFQKKTVPLFLAHLKELLPERYEELIVQHPNFDDKIDYIGRKALLKTIKPSHVYYESSNSKFDEEWYWNGETLEYEDGYVSSFNIVKDCEIVKIVIKPSEDATIKISSNDQVTEKTVFID